MVAVGRGGTEIGVAVTDGTMTLVACTDMPVDEVEGVADDVGDGDDVGVGEGVSDGAELDVSVAGTTGVAEGWIVKRRAMTVPGGTVGTSGSRASGLGRVTE
jgi:hypothetical protein